MCAHTRVVLCVYVHVSACVRTHARIIYVCVHLRARASVCVCVWLQAPDQAIMDQVAVVHLAESVKVAKLLQQWKQRAAQVSGPHTHTPYML